MYADYLVLISLSSAGLSQLLNECEKFGTRHDVKYNAQKSAVMIIIQIDDFERNYKKSNITKLQIAYHNIFLMFLGMSKYESTSYLCTLFDIQRCQSVIRKLVYGFMCRLDSSINCIIKGILATSLRYTSMIRKHWCSLLYILIVDRTIQALCTTHCM